MFDVIALGELLVDFTPFGKSINNMDMFEQNPGGAPANVLACLSKFGMKTAFVGKVGDDMHGDFLKKILEDLNICTEGLITDKDFFTTLAFVSISKTGERNFSFARKPGADTNLKPEELLQSQFNNTKIFHFGSLSLTDNPSRLATLKAIKLAKEAKAIISYDPNYRKPLWKTEEEAVLQMRSVLKDVDIIKISDEETELITGVKCPKEATKILLGMGIMCVIVTLGKEGALISTKSTTVCLKAKSTNVVDTTGAGDSFFGGILYKLLESNKPISQLTENDIKDFGNFAATTASICIQRRGAIPAMPSLQEVLSSLS
jgi:fructokinase